MRELTPQSFWPAYREQLRRLGSWQAYQSNVEWTEIAKRAAEAACAEFGIETSREYYRLDVCGYVTRSKYDWDLRVAFEVEGGANWDDELCKLTYLAADLRVLSAYECHKRRTACERLRKFAPTYRERMTRVPDSQWLFVFGPAWQKLGDVWTAWTLDAKQEITAIPDDRVLRGIDMESDRQLS